MRIRPGPHHPIFPCDAHAAPRVATVVAIIIRIFHLRREDPLGRLSPSKLFEFIIKRNVI